MTQGELIELLDEKVGVLASRVHINQKAKEITDITYNSKACKEGCVFFAKGVNFKEEYIMEAVNNGATLVIADKEYETGDSGMVIVKDIRKAMVNVAERFFGNAAEKIQIIGLTGTKGKTTTATYIHNILNEYVKSRTGLLSTVETYTGYRCEESHLSTMEAIELQRYIKEAVDNNLTYLTMEVSSQAYKTHRIGNMQFNIGLFLNIEEDHISPAEHENFNDYLNCKLEFVKNCNKVIINRETKHFNSVLDVTKNADHVLTFGSSKVKDDVNYYYTNLRRDEEYLVFDVVQDGLTETYRTKMLGEYNVQNALAAIVVAKELNIGYETIYEGIQKTTVPGRMMTFKKENKTVIVDYAHNKLSFERFFEALSKEYPEKEITAVFGAPGGKAYARRKAMAEIASKYCTKVYLTADDPQFEQVKDICAEIATFVTCDYEIIEDRQQAITNAFKNMEENGVLCLLAKGEDKYQQIRGKLEHYISDAEIAKILTK